MSSNDARRAPRRSIGHRRRSPRGRGRRLRRTRAGRAPPRRSPASPRCRRRLLSARSPQAGAEAAVGVRFAASLSRSSSWLPRRVGGLGGVLQGHLSWCVPRGRSRRRLSRPSRRLLEPAGGPAEPSVEDRASSAPPRSSPRSPRGTGPPAFWRRADEWALGPPGLRTARGIEYDDLGICWSRTRGVMPPFAERAVPDVHCVGLEQADPPRGTPASGGSRISTAMSARRRGPEEVGDCLPGAARPRRCRSRCCRRLRDDSTPAALDYT